MPPRPPQPSASLAWSPHPRSCQELPPCPSPENGERILTGLLSTASLGALCPARPAPPRPLPTPHPNPVPAAPGSACHRGSVAPFVIFRSTWSLTDFIPGPGGEGVFRAPAHRPTSSLAWVSSAPLLRAGTMPAAPTHPRAGGAAARDHTRDAQNPGPFYPAPCPQGLTQLKGTPSAPLFLTTCPVAGTTERGGHGPHPWGMGWLRQPACGLGHRYSGPRGDFMLWVQRPARHQGTRPLRGRGHVGSAPRSCRSRGLPWRVGDSIGWREADRPHTRTGSRGSWEPRAPLTPSVTLYLTTS